MVLNARVVICKDSDKSHGSLSTFAYNFVSFKNFIKFCKQKLITTSSSTIRVINSFFVYRRILEMFEFNLYGCVKKNYTNHGFCPITS